jgi:hypothetical protein
VKNKLIILISSLSIVTGLSGFILINRPSPETTNFDENFSKDKNVFISKDQRISARISSIKRLAVKKDRRLRGWILEHFDSLDLRLKQVSLEEIGYFTDDEVNKFIFEKLNVFDLRQSSLRSLGKVENEKRAKLLEEVDSSNFSNLDLIDLNFAIFKSNIFFSKKKGPLNFLLDLALKMKDGKDLDYLVKTLTIHVPNYERVHELLKTLLIKSESISIIELSIKHLTVYEPGWMKVNMSNIFKTANETKIKFYLDRAPALCPIRYWEIIDKYYLDWKEYILFSAFSLNTLKAKEFLIKKEGKSSKLYNGFKVRLNETVKLCY